jgi:hypothetical protein
MALSTQTTHAVAAPSNTIRLPSLFHAIRLEFLPLLALAIPLVAGLASSTFLRAASA